MSALVWEVAEGVDHPIAQRLAQSQHHPAKALTIRAQEISVRDDFDGVGHAAAPDVVALEIDRPL
jgi:hypothetical protein